MEEEELDMVDESIDRFEHSRFRPDASVGTTWLGAVNEHGAARSRTANKSSIFALFFEQIVDAPASQITVELMKEIVQQIVAAPMPQIMRIRGRCADHTTGVHACVPVLWKKLLR